MVPMGLGRTSGEQLENLVGLLDAFFGTTGYHANVNVLNKEMLFDAMEHPENYPSLTMSSKLRVAAIGAWLLVATYYFYQYALRSAPSVAKT